jgi:hypothetical protein
MVTARHNSEKYAAGEGDFCNLLTVGVGPNPKHEEINYVCGPNREF